MMELLTSHPVAVFVVYLCLLVLDHRGVFNRLPSKRGRYLSWHRSTDPDEYLPDAARDLPIVGGLWQLPLVDHTDWVVVNPLTQWFVWRPASLGLYVAQLIYYRVLLPGVAELGFLRMYVWFFPSRILHEVAHGVVLGITGGTFGFEGTAGNIWRGYGVAGVFGGVIPVFYVTVPAYAGSDLGYFLSVAAGPAVGIVLPLFLSIQWAGTRTDPESWWKSQWRLYGLLSAAAIDMIYIGPFDILPGEELGDGEILNAWLVEHGLTVAGVDLTAVIEPPGLFLTAIAGLSTCVTLLYVFDFGPSPTRTVTSQGVDHRQRR